MKKIATLGAGSWGTALATHLSRLDHQVYLWGRDSDQIKHLQQDQINERYLPGIKLPSNLQYSDDLQGTIANCNVVIIATPCHCFGEMLHAIAPALNEQTGIIWACKGITENQLLHSVLAERLQRQYPAAIISGPSFAAELAKGLPTAATVAAEDIEFAKEASTWFHSDTFRAYASDDIVGVQIAGALKNVYAIAAGIADGLGFGANARAALITRGMAELTRLGNAMGAKSETLMGLSGVGDLILTCTDNQSRNRRFGLALGQGYSTQNATEQIGQVVEGINTCKEAVDLASQHQVDMPITFEVFNVVHRNKDAREAVADLLARTQKQEIS